MQHLQPPLGLRRQRLSDRQGEQRIGTRLGAPHPAAQLVELGKAEHVGAMDDQRVGGGNVQSGLNDGGRQQHIVFAVVEGIHHVIELARRHLAMGGGEFEFRHMLAQKLRLFLQIADARTDIEALSAAIMLAQQRLADHKPVERRHEGPHRQPVEWRRGDQREFAHARQRQLQRARDRRRRQRQHMHVAAQLLELFLVLDAETLFLVDDQQAQPVETDAVCQKRMGADDDVDGAIGNPLAGGRQFARRNQPRGLRDFHRQAGKAVAEGLVVLTGQQGCRHDDGDLFSRHGGNEGSPERYLRLAETDIAADQPVHRRASGKIVQHRLDCRKLILRLVIGEAGDKLAVKPLGRRQRFAVAQGPFGGNGNQLACDFEQLLLQLRLARLPGNAAQPVELHFRIARPVA